jgi:DNA excision repair protein ERCC-2
VTLRLYIDWLEQIDRHEAEREKSLAGLQFPFPEYRAGQKDLIDAVYRNILNREILYAIAPTGVGKTIATLYPALKAINKKDQKVFYLTAKNLGKKSRPRHR